MVKKSNGTAVILAEVGRFEVRMLMRTDSTTMLSDGICIALFDKKTGFPCVGDGDDGIRPYLRLKKQEVLDTSETFHQLRVFDVSFTIDQLKEALVIAQATLKKAEETLKMQGNKPLQEVYQGLVRCAFQHQDECDEKGVPLILIKPQALWIQKDMMECLLDRVGYKKTVTIFCKEWTVFAGFMGLEAIPCNRKAGYISVTTVHKVPNWEHYRMNLFAELIKRR